MSAASLPEPMEESPPSPQKTDVFKSQQGTASWTPSPKHKRFRKEEALLWEAAKKEFNKRTGNSKFTAELPFTDAFTSLRTNMVVDLTTCLEDYVLENVSIGKGAYGVVFLATDPTRPGMEFAIKFQLNGPIYDTANDGKLRQWNREMDMLHRMNARGIGPHLYASWRCTSVDKHNVIHGIGVSVTDRWDGNLSRQAVLTEAQIAVLEAQMDTIHSMGLVHGDIFEKNVLVRYNVRGERASGIAQLTLADFGLMREREVFLTAQDSFLNYHLEDIREAFKQEPRTVDRIFLWKMREKLHFNGVLAKGTPDKASGIILGTPERRGLNCSVCDVPLVRPKMCADCKQVPFCGEECASRDTRVKVVGGVGCAH